MRNICKWKKNGNGKEYKINGKLEYEGTFLDGKRHGKGKEFYKNGTIEFEGEYLYNFKYKGKYYINQKLEYEGIYEYGNKWNGKGYDEYGNIIYELNNGNGKVKEYEDGELYLEGEYLNGKRNGKCKQYFEGKLVLDGEYLNGIQNGYWKEYDEGGVIEFEGKMAKAKNTILIVF